MAIPEDEQINVANGWHEYAKFVLNELERLGDCYTQLAETQKGDYNKSSEERAKIRVEVAKLQVKASLWGAVAGAIPAAIAIIWFLSQRAG